jgi:diacylglycerol kinase family enzyme
MASRLPGTVRPSFILNGKSVHLEAARGQIERISNELGAEANVLITKRGDDVPSLAARVAGEGRQPVVAGGGDGTVSAVAGALSGTDTALGVLPMGTLNHFAKDVGVPLNLEAAVRSAFTGRFAEVDVGEVNGRVFVNNSGVGFYPHFVRQREEEERYGHPKRVAFLLALRSVVRRYFRLRIRAHMDREHALEQVTPFLFVGNNRYQTSGLKIGTRSRLDTGQLWVCTAPQTGRESLQRAALRMLLGRKTDEELNAFETTEVWIEPGTPQVNVSTDGEVSVMSAPLHYRIRPRALRVVLASGP